MDLLLLPDGGCQVVTSGRSSSQPSLWPVTRGQAAFCVAQQHPAILSSLLSYLRRRAFLHTERTYAEVTLLTLAPAAPATSCASPSTANRGECNGQQDFGADAVAPWQSAAGLSCSHMPGPADTSRPALTLLSVSLGLGSVQPLQGQELLRPSMHVRNVSLVRGRREEELVLVG